MKVNKEDNIHFEDTCFSLKNPLPTTKNSSTTNFSFYHCEFLNLDLTSMDLSHWNLSECSFSRCNLSNASLMAASLRDVKFIDSKLQGVNFSECNQLYKLNFEDSILDYCVFQKVHIPQFSAINCRFKEVDISESQLAKAIFQDCDLSECHFSHTNLESADFRGAYNYYIDPQLTKIKKARFSTPEALNLLRPFDIRLE